MKLRGRTNVVSWITSDKHYKSDYLFSRDITMVELTYSIKYGWVDVEVVGTLSVLSTEAVIDVVSVVIGGPLDLAVLLLDLENIICKSFDDSSFPFYKCMFTRIRLLLPSFDFEVVILKYLKVSPFQLYIVS